MIKKAAGIFALTMVAAGGAAAADMGGCPCLQELRGRLREPEGSQRVEPSHHPGDGERDRRALRQRRADLGNGERPGESVDAVSMGSSGPGRLRDCPWLSVDQ